MGEGEGWIVHSETPLNAEPPLGRLMEAPNTAQGDFYVRTHGTVPRLDAASHRLRVGGAVTTPLDLSVPELLERFPLRRVVAVMQCAGNRRADLQPVRPTTGDPWAGGAIGNAEWSGVALADVLRAAGPETGAKTGAKTGGETGASWHVAFDCCDEVEMPEEGRFRFGVSIPISKAMSPEVLLAVAMNGQALAPEHGFPLRVVTPGFAGVRSPKWLAGITVQDRPSNNHMQQRDYKMLPAEMSEATVDWARGVEINDMPLNAAICEPASGASLPAGPLTLRGYAVATARAVARVEVSLDGGRSWSEAALQHGEGPWSWTLWHATIQLPPGRHELAVRAWDSAGQTQPARPDDTWNFKGYLSAAWHRVFVSAA